MCTVVSIADVKLFSINCWFSCAAAEAFDAVFFVAVVDLLESMPGCVSCVEAGVA